MLIFRAMNGSPLNRRYLTVCFRRLQDIAAVRRRDDDARPFRMRDFRATFAVHRLTSWIRQGADLNNMIPALSAYMGYSGLATAEKFLSLTPERFRSELRKLCPQPRRTRWRDSSKLMHYLAEL
jgi:hypothetical protein